MMNHHAKSLYVLADGARARFVERREEPRSFVTIEEIDSRDQLRALRQELRASPPSRVMQSGSAGRRHTVGPDDAVQRAKTDFIATVAGRATELYRARGCSEMVVAAPDRLLAPLRERLEDGGATVTLPTPNNTFAKILSIFPLTSPFNMVGRTVTSNVPAWQLALSLALLIVTATAGVLLAGRIYKVGVLMYGQKASVRSIFRRDIQTTSR